MDAIKIGLCGYARSGKDTVDKYLCEHYGFVRFAFGDELKRYTHELFEVEDGKPRELYQWFGQTMRQRDPDIWVRKMFESIERYGHEWKLPFNVVVSDLRQPNEYERLKAEGFVFIRVNANTGARLGRMAAEGDSFNVEDLTHETERHIDLFPVNYDIYNDGGFTGLYYQIDYVMADILSKHRRAK